MRVCHAFKTAVLGKGPYYVQCLCGKTGPQQPEPFQAVKAWNAMQEAARKEGK